MQTQQLPEAQIRRWLSVEEAAEYTSLSVKTIRRMIERGKLLGHRPTGHRGRIIVDRAELDALVLSS